MSYKKDLLENITKLFEKFYCSKISASKFGEILENFWKENKNEIILWHPVYDLHLIGELYLDYDAFRKKPDYRNFEINEEELKMRCIETIKAMILIEPKVKNYLDYPKVLDQKLSIEQIENRLSKNGRILMLLKKKFSNKENLIVIWITLDKQTNNYFVSIENWSLNFNEKKEKYPKSKEYGFNDLDSLFKYLVQNYSSLKNSVNWSKK